MKLRRVYQRPACEHRLRCRPLGEPVASVVLRCRTLLRRGLAGSDLDLVQEAWVCELYVRVVLQMSEVGGRAATLTRERGHHRQAFQELLRITVELQKVPRAQ